MPVVPQEGVGAFVWRGGGTSSRFALYGGDVSAQGELRVPVATWFVLMERAQKVYQRLSESERKTPNAEAVVQRIARLVQEARAEAWIDVQGMAVRADLAEQIEAAVGAGEAEVRALEARARQSPAAEAHDIRYDQAVQLMTGGTAALPSAPPVLSSREMLRRAVLSAERRDEFREVPSSEPRGGAARDLEGYALAGRIPVSAPLVTQPHTPQEGLGGIVKLGVVGLLAYAIFG